MISITSHQFQRNIGEIQDQAMSEPVTITRHGCEWLVLLSAAEYRDLQKRSRKVLHVSELDDSDIQAIDSSEMAPEHESLNSLIK